MNKSIVSRLSIEIAITLLIITGFAYHLTGSILHEVFGMLMLLLIVIHHLFNYSWYMHLHKGRYRPIRAFATGINIGLALATLTMLGSGVLNSYLLEDLLRISWTLEMRDLHNSSAHWYLLFVSIHLGMHWSMLSNLSSNIFKLKRDSRVCALLLKLCALGLFVYGANSFVERNITAKLFVQISYDFWDFKASTWPFFAQYSSIMAMIAIVTHYGVCFSRGNNSKVNLLCTR